MKNCHDILKVETIHSTECKVKLFINFVYP